VNRRLYRSVHERVLGGVAGGVAEYFDLDPSLVRVAWAILILASVGGFFLLYIVMWIVVPEMPAGYTGGRSWGGPAAAVPPAVPPPAAMPPAGDPQAESGTPTGESASDATAEATAPGDTAAAPSTSGTTPGSSPDYYASSGWSDHRYDHRRHRRSGGGGIVIGALLVLVGAWFLVRDTFSWIHLPELWPVLVIGLGLLLLYGAVRPRSD
jgi:phage shock protein C